MGGRISSSGNPSFFGNPFDLFYAGLSITSSGFKTRFDVSIFLWLL
jgi:hypothetical protein